MTVFEKILAAAGIDFSEKKLENELQQLAGQSGVTIADPSIFSAFWVFVRAAAVRPVRWIFEMLLERIWPDCFVKTARGEALELLADTYALTRRTGSFAEGELLFSRVAGNAGELIIPVGTMVHTGAINGQVYRMETLIEAVMLSGMAEVALPARSTIAGSAANLGDNYYNRLGNEWAGALTATNKHGYLTKPGTDPESDDELRSRIRMKFLSAGNWFTDARYISMISELAGISTDQIYIDHDVNLPGCADVYLILNYGETPKKTIDEINAYIADGHHGHGDRVTLKALEPMMVTLSVHIRAKRNRDGALLAQQTEDFIRCAFRQNAGYQNVTRVFPFEVFSMSKLAQEMHNQFDDLERLKIDQADLEVGLAMPSLESLTVTLEA